jgi:tetratricopeptide (TPR) repeat protein
VRRQVSQNPFTILFLFYLLAFGVLFFYSIFAFPDYLGAFQWPFVWTNSFLLFMRYCIPLTVSAVAVAYSLLPTAEPVRMRARRQPFSSLVTSHLTTFIALAVVYTILIVGLYPLAARNMERFDILTQEAHTFLEKAETALAEEDRQTALLNYQRYLAIDDNNRAIMELVSDLQMELIADRPRPQPEEEQGLDAMRINDLAEGKEPYELLEIAEGFYEREDYFSAHYYADLAYKLNPNRRDAQRLAARAREMIASKDLSKLEEEEKLLFERKREGYEYFINGQFYQAYRVFRELQGRYPQDADVISYLKKSEERLSEQSFFLEEAEQIDTLPGVTELLFLNNDQDDEREIVYIGKLAIVDTGIFCKDIEVLRFGDQGLLYHYYAPYAKFRDGMLNLHGVARLSGDRSAVGRGTGQTSAESRETVPRYLSGASRLRGERLPYILALKPTLAQLPTLRGGSTVSATKASLGFFSLWQARRQIGSFGYLESAVSAEILRRMLLPFSFLILCLFSAALGWRFQASFRSRPHWILLIFMPLFPIAAVPLVGLYMYAQRILMDFVLLRLGFSITLIVFLVLQGLLLFLAMIILAGQRTD